MNNCVLPWFNWNSWLGVKSQLPTYLAGLVMRNVSLFQELNTKILWLVVLSKNPLKHLSFEISCRSLPLSEIYVCAHILVYRSICLLLFHFLGCNGLLNSVLFCSWWFLWTKHLILNSVIAELTLRTMWFYLCWCNCVSECVRSTGVCACCVS